MVEQNFVCPFCGENYNTKEGLAKHLKKCEAKPDIEDIEDAPTDGVKLFSGANDDDDDKPVYCCPDCSYRSEKAFSTCPKCGCEVEF